MARTYETTLLGDTLHLYSLLAQRDEQVPVEVCARYVPLLETLSRPYPFIAAPVTRWQPQASTPWVGPRHGEHVRVTLARCLGIDDRAGPLWEGSWMPARRPYVVFCPHANRPYKEWPAERWQALAVATRALGAEVEWSWAPGRVRRTHALPDLARLIRCAHAVVSVDSGPVHLAAHHGVPVIGLYGTTSARTYGPFFDARFCVDRHAKAWSAAQDYHSAHHLRGQAMGLINVEAVVAQLHRALQFSFSPTAVA